MMPTYKFSLPFPPSTNHLYRHSVRGRRVHVSLSDEYAMYQWLAARDLKMQGVCRQVDTHAFYRVELDIHVPVHRCDLDNYEKATIDAICRHMGFDDNRIYEKVSRKHISRADPHVDVVLSTLEGSCQEPKRRRKSSSPAP